MQAVADASSAHGWHWDPVDLTLVVRLPDTGAFSLAATYPPAISEAAPLVAVPLTVTVPPGTPGTLHLAHSANGWTHTPMKPVGAPDTWTGTALVPRGEWFEYKYTRGGWDSVEKWPGCVEAANRYAYGTAHPDHLTSGVISLASPGKRDTVFAWADLCQ